MNRRNQIALIALAIVACVFILQIPNTLARRGMGYDAIDLLVNVHAEISQRYVEPSKSNELAEAAVRGMLESLNDPYTIYLSAEQLDRFDKNTLGTFSGIGAEIDRKDGQLRIVSPLEDSPAFEAGVQPGDLILEVDGKSTDDMEIFEAIEHITGEEGTDVVLLIRHPDGEELPITITRQRINIQTVKALWRGGNHHWEHMLDSERGIGYVRLTQFNNTSDEDLRAAIEGLVAQDMQGLILDLRFNPGGLLDQAENISSMFLDDGVIVSTKGHRSKEETRRAKASDTLPRFPVIVMVNEYSASASEIVSGALKDNGRAVILGTRTYGKGSVQQVVKLDSSPGAIKLTTAHYYLPSGRNIHRKEDSEVWGVDPTDGYYVPMNDEQYREMNLIRREKGIVRSDGSDAGSPDGTATPDWIEDELKDTQLAAAYRSMIARMDDGAFEPVGGSDATLLTRMLEIEKLQSQREQYLEAVAKIEDEIAKLESHQDVETDEATAGLPELDPEGPETHSESLNAPVEVESVEP